MIALAEPLPVKHSSGRRELILFAAAYLLYVAARWLFVGDPATARANAGQLLDLERWSGIDVEGSIQRALSADLMATALSGVYLAAQLVVLPMALVVLYHFARPIYRTARSTVIATWMLSVPIFAAFPVAPPRLAGIGVTDLVSASAGGAVSLTGSSTLFYNPYAALPSLHVGLAFAIGIAIAASVRSPALKILAAMWGPLVSVTVVATGNHYVVDVAAGLAITALGWRVGRAVARANAPQDALRRLAASTRDPLMRLPSRSTTVLHPGSAKTAAPRTARLTDRKIG